MRRQKQQPEPEPAPEWDGTITLNNAQTETNLYGQERERTGISAIVFEVVDPTFRAEIGAEIALRVVAIKRETVER